MGEVWRARDARLQRDVAVKVLPTEVSSDAGRLKRFEKEARSASALNHPNIVTIYDIGSSDSVSYIAMELVKGKTLRELLFAGSLPIKRVLSITSQVADGLARAGSAASVVLRRSPRLCHGWEGSVVQHLSSRGRDRAQNALE
jgi:serine/threonine protein kinase